ncbi:MAG TPA: hypothetical protein VH591_11005 [Ktedonobacterales bacterium]|jgi:hypothetical protein
MPQNDADRIARQRAQQQNDQEEAARRAEKARLQSLITQIEAEIPVVLRLLSKHGYPDVVEVYVRISYGSSWIGEYLDYFRKKTDTKAGWKIGEFKDYDLDRFSNVPIYLLSDGRICVNDNVSAKSTWPPYGIDFFIANYGDMCLNGLRELRRKLETM